MSLDSRLHLGFKSTQRGGGLVVGTGAIDFDLHTVLTNGLGAGKADLLFAETRTLAASGTYALDLAGALVDTFGGAVVVARVKALLVKALPANTNNVVIGGAAANGFISWVGDATDKVVLRPGAAILLVAGVADAIGYAVTAATGDLLQFTNSAAGTGVTYDVAVLGCSA